CGPGGGGGGGTRAAPARAAPADDELGAVQRHDPAGPDGREPPWSDTSPRSRRTSSVLTREDFTHGHDQGPVAGHFRPGRPRRGPPAGGGRGAPLARPVVGGRTATAGHLAGPVRPVRPRPGPVAVAARRAGPLEPRELGGGRGRRDLPRPQPGRGVRAL